MAGITREALNKQIAANPVAQKYAKRISLLESARKAVGAKPMSTFEKYYAGNQRPFTGQWKARTFEKTGRVNI